ncbi:hypothetical protein BDV96DRAFT_646449 [Lophiotrema nucula]|uniref:Poly(A) RNA polymerase mitochondrial-like central palm domain-containing protein n=1 Tax=Lophiotrema nucula TaxID=690887 RepID=A0A6A5Z948_9PLEO|nr:hypothetical protein BDV96DRAFT_646449 [Lophiotrema nucula]
MPSMQSSSPHLICRSRNPFSPAAALWQHFVVPNRPFLNHLRQSSSVAEASEPDEIGLEAFDSESPQIKRDVTKLAHKVLLNGNNNLAAAVPPATMAMVKMRKILKDKGNYDGIVVHLPAPPKSSRVQASDLPWSFQRIRHKYKLRGRGLGKVGDSTGLQQLKHEIYEFHAYMQPTALEALARQSVIESVGKLIHPVARNLTVELFGSERTGLAFATSDLDLRLFNPRDNAIVPQILPPTLNRRRQLMGKLYKLQYHLKRQQAKFHRIEMRHARYPLLSMQDSGTGLDIQVVLSNDTRLSRELMAKYMEEYPYLSELYTIVKTFFDVRGLSDVYRGGFGSYNIFMMIVASLKHSPPEESDSAYALINFLRFWATFDTKARGISIDPVELYDKSETQVASDSTMKKLEESKTRLPDFMLSLRDPADATNDLGRKGICIKHVQATCKHNYHQLVHDVDVNNVTLIKSLVGHIFAINKEARAKLEARGKEIAESKKRLTPYDETRLMLLARSILAGSAGKEEGIATTETRNATEKGQSAVDPSDAIYDHGEVMVSSFGMPTVEELAQDEARELAERQATLVDGQNEAREQGQDIDSSEHTNVEAPREAQNQSLL